jgi:hypothetical protein
MTAYLKMYTMIVSHISSVELKPLTLKTKDPREHPIALREMVSFEVFPDKARLCLHNTRHENHADTNPLRQRHVESEDRLYRDHKQIDIRYGTECTLHNGQHIRSLSRAG